MLGKWVSVFAPPDSTVVTIHFATDVKSWLFPKNYVVLKGLLVSNAVMNSERVYLYQKFS